MSIKSTFVNYLMLFIFSVIGFSSDIMPALSQNPVTAVVRAGSSTIIPQFYSGTNCKASWGGQTDAIYLTVGPWGTPMLRRAYIAHVKFTIGGDVVFEQDYPDSYRYSQDGSATFDSTHLTDGVPSHLHVELTDSPGNVGTADSGALGVAYNKAYIFGNQLPNDGIGSLNFGLEAVTRVNSVISTTHYSCIPGALLFQQKSDIAAVLPKATLLYCDTHGVGGANSAAAFCDSAGYPNDGALRFATHWLVGGDVNQAIFDQNNGKQVFNFPSYNFVFLDACSVGGQMVADFDLAGITTDRGYLGWDEDILDNLGNVLWTQRLMQSLASGLELNYAILAANDGGMVKNPMQQDVPVVQAGDPLFKLKGVYGIAASSVWFRLTKRRM